MEEPEQVPAPRPQRHVAKRLLIVGLAGLLVVAVAAVSRADVMNPFLSGEATEHVGGTTSSMSAMMESSAVAGSPRSGTGSASGTAHGTTAHGATAHGTTDHGATSGTIGTMGTDQGRAIALPRDVTPPPGSRIITTLRGAGVLVFTCTGGVFQPTEPAQNLFALDGTPVGIHFGPPSWESTRDGSRVDAVPVKVTRVRHAAPRVLFKALNVHGGQGLFGRTAFIVQMPMTGGVAPAACTVPGKRIGVPFQSMYMFFRSATGTTPPSTTPATTRPTMTTPMAAAAGGTTLYGSHW
jgi:hypothetical protein